MAPSRIVALHTLLVLSTAIWPSNAAGQCRGGGVGGGQLSDRVVYDYSYEKCDPNRLSVLVVWRGAPGWISRIESVGANRRSAERFDDLIEQYTRDGYGVGGRVTSRGFLGLAWQYRRRVGRVVSMAWDASEPTIIDSIQLDSDSVYVVLIDGADQIAEGPTILEHRRLAPATTEGLRPEDSDILARSDIERSEPPTWDPPVALRRLFQGWPDAIRFVEGN